MSRSPEMTSRRSIRLRRYDYAKAGAYFVTVCTQNKECTFGEIAQGEMRLNEAGRVVEEVWNGLSRHYPKVEVDAFVVMPNHIHGVVILEHAGGGEPGRAGLRPAPTDVGVTRYPLTEIVRAFKSFAARRINEARGMPGARVWQRNYYEHVIRNEKELLGIRKYIVDNPARWALDEENPGVV